MGPGQHLGRPEIERTILRIVENLEVVERRAIFGVAVAVPVLGRRRAVDTVVAHYDWKSKILTQ